MATRPDPLVLALHGPNAACHETHPGARPFFATIEAIARGREQGRAVYVGSLISRSSCRSLVALGDRLAGWGVAGWTLVWPRRRLPPEQMQREVPRLGIAVPHALAATQRAERRGIAVGLAGLPACVTGPFARLRIEAGAAGEHPRVCEGCEARAECPGLDGWYHQRFGARELHVVPAVARVRREAGLLEGLIAAGRLPTELA